MTYQTKNPQTEISIRISSGVGKIQVVIDKGLETHEYSLELKTLWGPGLRKAATFCEFLPPGALTGSHNEVSEESLVFPEGGGKKYHFKIHPEHAILNKACSQKKLFFQSLTKVGFTRA